MNRRNKDEKLAVVRGKGHFAARCRSIARGAPSLRSTNIQLNEWGVSALLLLLVSASPEGLAAAPVEVTNFGSNPANPYGLPRRLIEPFRPCSASSARYASEAYWADSSGRRNTRFVGRSEQLVKRLRRRSPIERLSGPRIEGCCNGCNRLDAVDAKIDTFWEVLA
jgi:hypothetical protein